MPRMLLLAAMHGFKAAGPIRGRAGWMIFHSAGGGVNVLLAQEAA
jgi:hypothetical protein